MKNNAKTVMIEFVDFRDVECKASNLIKTDVDHVIIGFDDYKRILSMLSEDKREIMRKEQIGGYRVVVA